VKPLLVGDQPTRDGDRYYHEPLGGVFARRLCRIAGLSGPSSRNDLAGWTALLYEHFECINALERHSGWDAGAAADRLAFKIVSRHEVVVLFGRKVQKAYAEMTKPASSAVGNADLYEWTTDVLSATGRRQVVVLPAPRLIGHLDPNRSRAVGRLLNEAIEKAKQMHETRL
jgi:hypothetical protein